MVAAAPARSRPASLSRALPAAVDRQAATARESRHDAELVRSFHAGNEAAFTEISVRHRGKLHSIAFGYFHNHADAEDIAQDALIRAHRALPRFRGDSSLATWLHHITANLSHNRYWYYRRRRLDREDPVPGFSRALPVFPALGPQAAGLSPDLPGRGWRRQRRPEDFSSARADCR